VHDPESSRCPQATSSGFTPSSLAVVGS
jgi:hypothetical protein